MRLKIDNFYQDKKLGRLKYKGTQEGNLIFDNYAKAVGVIGVQRATFHPVLQANRIAKLTSSFPPA